MARLPSGEYLPMTRKRIVLALTGIVLVLLFGAAYWIWDVSRAPQIPQNLGNWPRILDALEVHPPDRPVSFAVVGDTHGSEVVEEILKGLRGVDLDFIVNLGDFVREPTVWAHRLFLKEMEEELPPTGPPMLLVVGNHDVDAQTFPLTVFERLYGPSTFSFECGGNLFVVLRNALPGEEKAKLWGADLEKILSQRRGTARRIFVFMHKPPVDPSRVWKSARMSRSMGILEKSGVDYVISGHLHRYGHTQIGRTEVLVSGGGGGRLRGSFGKFHHTVVIRAFGDHVTEEILPVSTPRNPEERLESYYLSRVFPWFRRLLNLPDPVLEGAAVP